MMNATYEIDRLQVLAESRLLHYFDHDSFHGRLAINNEYSRLMMLLSNTFQVLKSSISVHSKVNTLYVYQTPMMLVSIVGSDRQCFRAKHGLINLSELPRHLSFCSYLFLQDSPDILIISDTTKDDRFKSNPLVVGYPHIRFYAGTPLTMHGVKIGSLCVMDTTPRNSDNLKSFSDCDSRMLKDIATMVSSLLYQDSDFAEVSPIEAFEADDVDSEIPAIQSCCTMSYDAMESESRVDGYETLSAAYSMLSIHTMNTEFADELDAAECCWASQQRYEKQQNCLAMSRLDNNDWNTLLNDDVHSSPSSKLLIAQVLSRLTTNLSVETISSTLPDLHKECFSHIEVLTLILSHLQRHAIITFDATVTYSVANRHIGAVEADGSLLSEVEIFQMLSSHSNHGHAGPRPRHSINREISYEAYVREGLWSQGFIVLTIVFVSPMNLHSQIVSEVESLSALLKSVQGSLRIDDCNEEIKLVIAVPFRSVVMPIRRSRSSAQSPPSSPRDVLSLNKNQGENDIVGRRSSSAETHAINNGLHRSLSLISSLSESQKHFPLSKKFHTLSTDMDGGVTEEDSDSFVLVFPGDDVDAISAQDGHECNNTSDAMLQLQCYLPIHVKGKSSSSNKQKQRVFKNLFKGISSLTNHICRMFSCSSSVYIVETVAPSLLSHDVNNIDGSSDSIDKPATPTKLLSHYPFKKTSAVFPSPS